jgi:hypothetical protein
MLMMKEASTAPLPIIPTRPFDKCFLPRPLTRKPIRGSNGINNTKFFISKTRLYVYCRKLFNGTGFCS